MQTVIRKLRLEKGLSRSGVCLEADFYEPQLSQFENRKNKAGKRVQARLAAALGVTVEDIFDSNGWPLIASTDLADDA